MNFKDLDLARQAFEKALEQGTRIVVEKTTGGNTAGNTAKAVAETGAALGAAASAATGLTVAATSGAGIAAGLAAAGGVVGGGMAAAPAVLAAGPTYIGTKIMNETLFKDQPDLSEEENDARAAARIATNIGAAAGIAGAGLATVAGGASGAAIMSTLAGIGGVVGGGAIAGTAIVAAAPVAAAAAIGYGVYEISKRYIFKQGELDKALQEFNKALELDPQLPKAYHGRGQIYRLKGEKANAIADFKQALQLTEDSEMRQELAQWLEELEAQG